MSFDIAARAFVPSVGRMSAGMPMERDRTADRSLVTALAIIVAVVVVLGGLFLYVRGFLPFDEDMRYYHSFVLVLEPTNSSAYEVVCPVPTDEEGELPPDFVEELAVVSGSPEYSLVEDDHGIGLKVESSGETRLEWHGIWSADDGEWYINMTMSNIVCGFPKDEPDEGCLLWFYVDATDLLVRMSYYAERTYNETPVFASGTGFGFSARATITDAGWDRLSAEYEMVAVN